jgi:fumarylacetoacetase
MTLSRNPNDPSLKSWIEAANDRDCDFSIQNLPYGVYSTVHRPTPRVGVAIGDQILDLSVLAEEKLLSTPVDVFRKPYINDFMALGIDEWKNTRHKISSLLDIDNPTLRDNTMLVEKSLVRIKDATLHLPIQVREYTDFYASREHATNVGTMFRDPDNALMPNWLHIPIGYNGRASTVVVSGTPIHRPLGQIKPPSANAPIFSQSKKLDIELEIAAVIGMPNKMGCPITTEQAQEMIFGYVILNDWSARDFQVWEYQPLGPFQSKVFGSTISPWVVTRHALEPFRQQGPEQTPTPLPYLLQKEGYNYDLNLEVTMRPETADQATTICKTNFKYMYWSSVQQLTHHAVSGCAMNTGDLLGSGTISGPTKNSFGSLLEITWNGKEAIEMDGGESRTFIEDGDTLTMTGWCQGEGYRVGFGEATGQILPSPDFPPAN